MNSKTSPTNYTWRVVSMTAFALLLFAIPRFSVAAKQPNVVVILTDDQGWGDLSLHGNTGLETPNIDALARAGAQFDRFYVCPVCSPTRAEFLTGRHHVRCGVYSTSAGGERVNADETMIGQVFKKAGYHTAAFGKWHSGMQYPYHPNARGFDEFYGFCSGHWGNYFSPMLEHNGQLTKGEGFIIDDLTNRAMNYIEKHRDKPFFVYLPLNTPHSPMQVPSRWWDEFKNKELTQLKGQNNAAKINHARAALAMCENIDWNVGRLLAKLDELKLAEDTIVVYFCDNGPNGDRWNGGMRGRKGSTDEGGVRSPLFVRWPGKIQAGVNVKPICAAMDLLPTLAELCNVPVKTAKPLDGKSFVPLLKGETSNWPDRTMVHVWRNKVSVRTQQHRLDHQGNLYDIPADPGQKTAINKQQPAVAAKLQAVADKFRKEMLATHGPGHENRPFVIGHPDALRTQIPARDGIAHGGIERSNRFPNDSFFRNWTSTQGKITWDCEVGQTGDYQVEIFYTCPKEDVGSTVQLSFNGSQLTGKITQPHDPPLQGMEHDRVKRMESYVKDFRRMTLGVIHLKQGKGALTLKALEMPGDEVMEFRLMLLTRVEK